MKMFCQLHPSFRLINSFVLSPTLSRTLVWFIALCCCSSSSSVYSLIVPQIDLVTSGGRSDYVKPGESFLMACSYLPERGETLKLIQWDLDGKVVYVHKQNMAHPMASGVLKDRVNLSNRSMNTFEVLNATVQMAGNYTCHAYSDLRMEPATVSRQLIVIVDSCDQNSWRTRSDMVNCREQISFSCSNVFPRPQPSCALYNEYTGSIVQSELVERIEQTNSHAFNLSLFRHYRAADLRRLNAPISFRCRLKVEYTAWTRTFSHHLFSDSGCLLAQPNQTLTRFASLDTVFGEISSRRSVLHSDQLNLLTGEPACLVGVREGAVGKLHCGRQDWNDAPLVLCINRTWVYVGQEQRSIVLQQINNGVRLNWSEISLDSHRTVVCGSAIQTSGYLCTLLFSLFLIYLF